MVYIYYLNGVNLILNSTYHIFVHILHTYYIGILLSRKTMVLCRRVYQLELIKKIIINKNEELKKIYIGAYINKY